MQEACARIRNLITLARNTERKGDGRMRESTVERKFTTEVKKAWWAGSQIRVPRIRWGA